MSDLFDGHPTVVPYFRLHDYAREFYSRANQGGLPTSITITERTLSNNQNMKEWQKEKFHWRTEDPDSKVIYPDDRDDAIALQPQRIRLFRVIYGSEQPITFLQ